MALPYTLTSARPAQLGLVVLQSDETIEQDMRRLLPSEAELLVSRVPSGTTLDTDMIAAMEGNLTASAALFPEAVKLKAAGYGCTSASAQIGSARVTELIRDGVATAHVTDPVAALIAACRALDISRLALINPYVASVSDRLRIVLEEAGIAVSHFGSFEEPIEANVVRISKSALRDAALEMGHHDTCDAVFLSCTNLRTLDVIDEIEANLNKPVLASNQVLAWHLLSLAGIVERRETPGRLFSLA